MAYDNNGLVLPFKAASAIGQGVIAAMPFGSPLNETVVPAPSSGFAGRPVGLTDATQASFGRELAIITSGIGKARAAASIGAGALVVPASVNGAVGPLVPSGLATALGSALGAAGPRWVVGYALTSAAAGEFLSVLIDIDYVL